MSDEQPPDVQVSDPYQRYLVKLDNGGWRLSRRDENGSAYQDISEEAAMQLREAGLPTRLERAEQRYQATREEQAARQQALIEALAQRGFLPDEKQGPVRLQRQDVEGGEPNFMAYSLDMRGNERKGPVSMEEARYLSGAYPEGVEEVPAQVDLVPAPRPPTEEQQRRMEALMAVLRGGG